MVYHNFPDSKGRNWRYISFLDTMESHKGVCCLSRESQYNYSGKLRIKQCLTQHASMTSKSFLGYIILYHFNSFYIIEHYAISPIISSISPEMGFIHPPKMAGLESAKQLPPHFSQHDINQSFQLHFWESFDGFPTGITAPPFRWSNRSAESALSSTMRRTWACARDRYLKSMAEKPPGIWSLHDLGCGTPTFFFGFDNNIIFWGSITYSDIFRDLIGLHWKHIQLCQPPVANMFFPVQPQLVDWPLW